MRISERPRNAEIVARNTESVALFATAFEIAAAFVQRHVTVDDAVRGLEREAHRLQCLTQGRDIPVPGEREYRSWLPEPGEIEYQSWEGVQK